MSRSCFWGCRGWHDQPRMYWPFWDTIRVTNRSQPTSFLWPCSVGPELIFYCCISRLLDLLARSYSPFPILNFGFHEVFPLNVSKSSSVFLVLLGVYLRLGPIVISYYSNQEINDSSIPLTYIYTCINRCHETIHTSTSVPMWNPNEAPEQPW